MPGKRLQAERILVSGSCGFIDTKVAGQPLDVGLVRIGDMNIHPDVQVKEWALQPLTHLGYTLNRPEPCLTRAKDEVAQ